MKYSDLEKKKHSIAFMMDEVKKCVINLNVDKIFDLISKYRS